MADDVENENALVPAGMPAPDPGALQVRAAAQAFLDEVKGPREEPASLPLVTIAHKDGGFVLPSGELVEAVEGYPVYYFRTRRYYARMFDPRTSKGQPPDCWSGDCVRPHPTSVEKQSETCADCPMNEFGTARDGKSKACGEYLWVFLLDPRLPQPPIRAVICPPSSLGSLLGTRFKQGYFARARAKAGVYEIVWTRLTLRPVEGGVHCVVEGSMGPVLQDPAQVKQLAHFRNRFIGLMDGLRLQTPNVGAEGGAEHGDDDGNDLAGQP